MKRKSALESLRIHGLEQKWYILAYIWYFFSCGPIDIGCAICKIILIL